MRLEPGEAVALIGRSGAGKTTLLRLLNGLATPAAGRVSIDGEPFSLSRRRAIGTILQAPALFPHRTVFDNIAYGLKKERLPPPKIKERVAEMLALVKLEPLAARKPDKLSGGQQQRVALARALVKRPKLLLLDEPLAALDKKLREHTQFELSNLQYQLGTTFVLVTHDRTLARKLDRVLELHEGRLRELASHEV
jgi:putrescine transport system ATP-binding protein